MKNKSVLIAWELGSGLGHVNPIRAIAIELLQRGCRVSIAARDLHVAGRALRDLEVDLFQAPHRLEPFRGPISPAISYQHLLHNIGFGDSDLLTALAQGWQGIFRAVQPEVILLEHSPVALFAARSHNALKGLLGTGFSIPPTPLPLLREPASLEEFHLEADAERTLQIANGVASRLGLSPLESLEQLYQAADARFFRTYPELDHFGPRSDAEYLGVSEKGRGEMPEWPDCFGPKVFAYLKQFAQGKDAIRRLSELSLRVVTYAPFMGKEEAQKLEMHLPNVRFYTTPLNIDAVLSSCDLVVSHGGHGLTAKSLLAGVPIVTIPLHQEQVLVSKRIVAQGMGASLSPSEIDLLRRTIMETIVSTEIRKNAGLFAQKYAEQPSKDLGKVVADWVGLTPLIGPRSGK